MKKNNLFSLLVLTSLWVAFAFKAPEKTTINGQASPEIKFLQLGDQTISLDESGSFRLDLDLKHSTLLTLIANKQDYEIYLEPGKEIHIDIRPDTIRFTGALVPENKHLLRDKAINEKLGPFLRKNWYSLHKKEEAEYIRVLDSLKAQFLTSMAQHTLNSRFVAINTASLNYSFDRMLLNYPRLHGYFTGRETRLSDEAFLGLSSRHDAPEYQSLRAYKRYVNTWIDYQLTTTLSENENTRYYGERFLKGALQVINQKFTHKALIDYWSWEYLKRHQENYTWINTKAHVAAFKKKCTTAAILEEAKILEEKEEALRKSHDVYMFKTIKGQQLEMHVFIPENFSTAQRYPALVAFHGGGWIEGSAAWTFGSARHAASTGMIGIAVEYRLSNYNDVSPKEAMEDTRDAILWVRAHAKALNINPDQVVAKGISAGGHLVSAIAVIQSAKPNAVPNALVMVSPALDTSDEYFKSLLLGEVDASTLSPLENLRADTKVPPTLILQGRTDNLTPTKYAEAFTQKMNALGYACTLAIYEDVGHLFTPSHLDDTGFPQPDPEVAKQAQKRQDEFLKSLGYLE